MDVRNVRNIRNHLDNKVPASSQSLFIWIRYRKPRLPRQSAHVLRSVSSAIDKSTDIMNAGNTPTASGSKLRKLQTSYLLSTYRRTSSVPCIVPLRQHQSLEVLWPNRQDTGMGVDGGPR
jgi:hypothetical protein